MNEAISAAPIKAEVAVRRPQAGRPPRNLWLPIFVVIAAPLIALLYAGFFGDLLPGFWMVFDPRMFALIVALGAVVVLLVWFVGLSGYSARLRWGTLAGILLFGALGCVTVSRYVRFVGYSGGMIPVFERITENAPVLEEPTVIETGRIDLTKTTPSDFPQFLGPRRDNRIMNVRLETDWEKSPPKLLWKQPIGEGWAGFAVVGGYAVTIQQRGEQEWTTCHELRTGKIVWKNAIAGLHKNALGGIGPRSTPTIDMGKIYVMHALGTLRCLDGGDGKTLWEHDLVAEFGLTPEMETAQMSWGRSASPLIHENAVIVPAGGPAGVRCVTLVAYDKNTGVKLWQGGRRAPSYASPVLATLDGVPQILIVSEDFAGSYDPKTGGLLWEVAWPGSSSGNANVSNARQIGPDRVFLSKEYGVGSMLLNVTRKDDAWTTKKLWADARSMRTKFSNVVFKDGFVFGLSAANLECADLATGKIRWRGTRFGYGQILGVGDDLLVLAEDGEVVLLEMSPRKENLLARFQAIDGVTWNPPVLAGKHLVVRNAKEAACYELPLAP